jgi:hemoglobin/transferrin/lactoferrin receptor protein
VLNRTLIAVAIAAASSGTYAETATETQHQNLDTLLIEGNAESTQSATNAETRVSAADGAVTITSKEMEDAQVSNLADALQGNAAVQIDEVGGSRGSEITIRGQSGNAVSVRVEGAPNNRSQIMHKGSNDRDTIWLNMDMYDTITVIPGAGANTYGNGSTGGVVLLETKDPESIIRNDRDWGANLRYTHETNGQSDGISGDVAKRFNDQFSANATLSIRDTDAYKDGNGYKTDNGSTGSEDLSYLIKGVYTPTNEHRIEASVMQNNKDYSDFDDAAVETEKEVREQTLSANYHYKPQNNDLVDLKIRLSRAESDQESDQGDGTWINTGGVTTTYFEAENTSLFSQSDRILHAVRYGIDYTYDDIRVSYKQDDGVTPKQVDRTSIGGYVSDNIHIGENLLVSGSLRYDKYEADYDGRVTDGKGSVNSKLSANWTPFESTAFHGLGFTALVGSGYRAPTVYEVFGKKYTDEYFTGTDADGDGIYETGNLAGCGQGNGNWCVIENPNLTGETSFDTEFGLTFERKNLLTANDRFKSKLLYIHNDLKDKIYNETLGTLDTSIGTYNGSAYNVRQFVNKDEAAVFGWELSAAYDNDLLFAHLSFSDMAGYVVEDDGSKTKDTSIIPQNIGASVGGYFSNHRGKVALDAKYREGRSYYGGRNGTTYYEYKSYTVFDLQTSYNVTDNLRVQARIDNLFDKTYSKSVLSADATTGADTTSYQPGRNYKLSLNYRF